MLVNNNTPNVSKVEIDSRIESGAGKREVGAEERNDDVYEGNFELYFFFFFNSLRLLLLGCLLNFIISFFFFEVEVNLTMLIILFKPNDKVGQFLHARVYYNFFKWNLDNLYRNNGRGYFFIKE